MSLSRASRAGTVVMTHTIHIVDTARSHHNQIGTVTSQNLFVLSHFSLFKGPTLSEMAQLRHFEKYCILANQPNNMSSVAHSHIWCNIVFPRIAHLALARNVVHFNDTLYLICFLNRKLAPPVWKYKSTKIPYVAKIHSVMQKTSGPLANDQSMRNFEKRHSKYEILILIKRCLVCEWVWCTLIKVWWNNKKSFPKCFS